MVSKEKGDYVIKRECLTAAAVAKEGFFFVEKAVKKLAQ